MLTKKELLWLENHNEIATFERLLKSSQDDPETIRDLSITIAGLQKYQDSLLSKEEQKALLKRMEADDTLKKEAQRSSLIREGIIRQMYHDTRKDWSDYLRWWPLALLLLLSVGAVAYSGSKSIFKYKKPESPVNVDITELSNIIQRKKIPELLHPPVIEPAVPDQPKAEVINTVRDRNFEYMDFQKISKNADIEVHTDFFISQQKITIGQYNKFVIETGNSRNKIMFKADTLPALVTKNQAFAYLTWYKLKSRQSINYFIPSSHQLRWAIKSKPETRNNPSVPEWMLRTDGNFEVMELKYNTGDKNQKVLESISSRLPAREERCSFRIAYY